MDLYGDALGIGERGVRGDSCRRYGAIEVQTVVPSVSYEVGPRDVKKPGCVYYRVRQFAPTPVYELCFADDRLAAKAIVN